MRSSTRSGIIQWTVCLVVLGILGFGVVRLVKGDPTDPKNLQASLEQRANRYIELRKQQDWVALYDMVDPKDRARVTQAKFLSVYGQGVLRVLEMHSRVESLDAAHKKAVVVYNGEQELAVDKLPPQYRRGLKMSSPDDARQKSEFKMDWTWRDQTWYFSLEREVVSGKDSKGRDIQFLDGTNGAEASAPDGPTSIPRAGK